MKDSIFYLFCSSLVPILGSDITAGSAGDIHSILILVSAVRAYPDKFTILFFYLDFSVKAAFLAIVGFGIEFGIHNIVIDKLDYRNHGIQVILHVRDLDIAYRSTCGESLELSFELQF